MSINRSFLCALAALPLLALAVGCSKSSTKSNTSGGSLTATVGASAFTSSIAVGVYSQTFDLFSVIGETIQSKDTSEIQLTFPYPPLVNHPVSSDTVQGIGLTYTVPGKQYDAYLSQGHWTLTITTGDTVNHTLAGTFSG